MTLALPAPNGMSADGLSPVQKAAILMMVCGEDTAAQILRTLSPNEVQLLGEAMYTVEGADHDTVDAVLNEFLSVVSTQTGLGVGAGGYVRRVLAIGNSSVPARSRHLRNFGHCESNARIYPCSITGKACVLSIA